jgi:G3E family GTPase
MLGNGIHAAGNRHRDSSPDQVAHLHDHPFATWHWTHDRPLSLPALRSAMEGLPDTIYRVKGIVYLEEMPSHQVVLQMVGKRYNIGDTEPWGSKLPRSEIVMIASQNGIDENKLQRAFDGCIGSGDESQSPILALHRFLAAGNGKAT